MSGYPSAVSTLAFTQEPQRILLSLPALLSETVQATPCIGALFARFRGAEITLLLDHRQHSLLQGTPWITRCRLRPSGRGSGRQWRELRAQLRAEGFDLAILLDDSLHTAWLCWRIGARRRVGFDRNHRGALLTDPLTAPAPGEYRSVPRVEYYASIARALGCPPPSPDFALRSTAAAAEAVTARLQAADVPERQPLVVLYPGADCGAVGCWPAERFAAVADHLVRRRGAVVVVTPEAGDGEEGRVIHRAMGHRAVLLDLPPLAPAEMNALVARADLVLGGESAGRQIAAAFGVPRVTVFGPTDPRRSESGHPGETIVRVPVPCGPCHRRRCPLEEQICMTRVSVEEVARACENRLHGNAGQRHA